MYSTNCFLERKTRGLWHTPNSIKAPYNRNGLISYKQATVVSYPGKRKQALVEGQSAAAADTLDHARAVEANLL
jgi:hypothetical protein